MKTKRLIAMLLCAMMLVSLLPAAVFADEGEDEEIVEVSFDAEEAEEALPEEPAEEKAAEEPAEEDTLPAEDENPAEDGELPAEEEEILPEEPETEDAENEFADYLAEGTCGDNAAWHIEVGGKLQITGTGAIYDYPGSENPGWMNTGITIKRIIIGNGITAVGSFAFFNLEEVTSISMASTVETIGRCAFARCDKLTEISIPTAVESIGERAFAEDLGLTKIRFLGEAPSIASDAFTNVVADADYNPFNKTWTDAVKKNYGGSITWMNYGPVEGSCGENAEWEILRSGALRISGTGAIADYSVSNPEWMQAPVSPKSISVLNGITVIGSYAFYQLGDVESVKLSETVATVKDRAFAGCTGLKEITLPVEIAYIGERAFAGDTALSSITFKGNAPVIEQNAFFGVTATVYYPADNSTWDSVVTGQYGGNITWKHEGYMSGQCGYNITWELSVDGTLTLSGTGNADDYNLPGEQPWSEYRNIIKNIVISSGITSIGSNMFRDCINAGNVSIPGTVISIGNSAFSGCAGLKEISIPVGVVTIGDHAFSGCTNVTSLNLSQTVAIIDRYAFYECSSITSVKLPDNLVRIGEAAFDRCSSLTGNFVIPASVQSVGGMFTAYCYRLFNVVFLGNAPVLETDAFYHFAGKVYYPAGNSTWTSDVLQPYLGVPVWTAYTPGALPAPVIMAAGGYCNEEQYLRWFLDTQGKLLIMGKGSMDNYHTEGSRPWEDYTDAIKQVEVNYIDASTFLGAPTIGDAAFADCKKLESVVLADGVGSIGEAAFAECAKLSSISIPASVKSIGEYAFADCTGLSSVTLNEGLKSIGKGAFTVCTKLKKADIPASVNSIGADAFEECSALEAIIVAAENSNYKSIDGVLFTNDGTVLIAYPANKAGDGYTVPAGVKTVGRNAFTGTSKLASITLPEGLDKILDYAFCDSKISSIRFSGNAPAFGSGVFGEVTATAYYPAGNKTWTSDVMQQYGGTVTWIPYGGSTAPVFTTIANHADYMIVCWNKVEGAASYQLAYREGSSAWQTMNVPLTSVDSKGNPRVNIKNLKQGVTYTFIAYALFADGTKTKSESAAQTRLLSPTVTAKAGNGYVSLNWNEVQGGSQYKIYYREKGGSWQMYAWVKKGVTSINIKESVISANGLTPLIKGHTYEFAVILGTSVAGITSGFPTALVSVKY